MNISSQRGHGLEAPRGKPTESGAEKESDAEKEDKAADEAEEESFPASDAPAYPDFK
jgi:hypothetical protein